MSRMNSFVELDFSRRPRKALRRAARRGLLLSGCLLCAAAGGAEDVPPLVASPSDGEKRALQVDAPAAESLEAPEATVRRLCEARKALDAAQMEAVLAEDYRGEQSDGSEIAYDRERGRQTADWERVMSTRWDYRILGVDGSAVTVLLTEESAYFDLLGIGTRTQVTVYFVDGGKVSRSLSKLDVQKHGSQAQEFRRFHAWLLQQIEQPEPELIGPDGRLIFDGKGAARMLHWLTKWHEAQK